jgi:hypothetical protein
MDEHIADLTRRIDALEYSLHTTLTDRCARTLKPLMTDLAALRLQFNNFTRPAIAAAIDRITKAETDHDALVDRVEDILDYIATEDPKTFKEKLAMPKGLPATTYIQLGATFDEVDHWRSHAESQGLALNNHITNVVDAAVARSTIYPTPWHNNATIWNEPPAASIPSPIYIQVPVTTGTAKRWISMARALTMSLQAYMSRELNAFTPPKTVEEPTP